MAGMISVSLNHPLFSRVFYYTAGQVELGCDLEENVTTLAIEWDELQRKKNDVLIGINHEVGPEMQRLSQVDGWIVRVTDMGMIIDKLIEHSNTKINKLARCIGCFAKRSKTRRSLEEKVPWMLKEVAYLKSKREFWIIEPTVGLEKLIDEVWRYINDDDVGIIGLYGIGGVGKTTLLTEINNRLSRESHGFDVLIWVPVSNNSNIETIQYEIGKKIGFDNDIWKNKNRAEKSRDIFSVLTQKKFVLLFDDIKVPFDLKDAGVPLQNTQNKSMVIFTTRSLDVCGQMDAQKKVEVKCLGDDEAWKLFKSKAGEYVLHCPGVIDIAKLVAKNCGGLPLALTIIGKMMAGKRSPEEWSLVLSMLTEIASPFTGLEREVFSILKVSYDNLPSDIERQCLLYCSHFPEDYYIRKQELINWFGETFLKDLDYGFNTAKLRGYSIIRTLINACLLEEDESGGVKMHDVIRSMALWLTEVPHDLHKTGVERIANVPESSSSASCFDPLKFITHIKGKKT